VVPPRLFRRWTPLGSKDNIECRIDAIAQSWSVIAGGGDPARAAQAMASSDRHLVREPDKIILLLTPPFDRMKPTPGYIQGYVPGVRENGGQYTHAALWTVLAFAGLGDGDRAAELFALLNPGEPRTHARRSRTLPRRALRRRRGRVFATTAYRPRRLDLVHRVGGMDVPGRGPKRILGITLERGALRINPCVPRSWPRFEARLADAARRAPDRGREPGRRVPRRRVDRARWRPQDGQAIKPRRVDGQHAWRGAWDGLKVRDGL
jgi:cyclic beta-1,2-glucan synthetase